MSNGPHESQSNHREQAEATLRGVDLNLFDVRDALGFGVDETQLRGLEIKVAFAQAQALQAVAYAILAIGSEGR